MKIAGTVVLYNPDEEVLTNIKTYIDSIDLLFAIDNSDKDNSELFRNTSNIIYIPNMRNLGIAKALNIAADLALQQGFDWLLTMDQDSQFQAGAINLILKYMNTHKNLNQIGIISPQHKTWMNENTLKKGIDEPIIVMTSGNFINLDIYKQIEGFKDWLFIDCVDFDYCLNLIRHGFKIVQINEAILNHELGDMIRRKFFGKEVLSDNHNAVRRYYIVRNRHYICDEYMRDFKSQCEAELKCTRREVRNIILFEKNKLKKLMFMLKGYLDYRNGITGEIGIKK